MSLTPLRQYNMSPNVGFALKSPRAPRQLIANAKPFFMSAGESLKYLSNRVGIRSSLDL